MKKSSLLLFLFLMFSTFCFSQSITLKGVVTDNTDYPLESATVYLTSVKDSTLVDYTITNKSGNWEMKIRQVDNPVNLKISFVGLANYSKQYESLTQDIDFGKIVLEDQSTELSEVVIEGEVPPVRIKSDTLEFNAASFKVRPDSNVKTLLEQLPGVVVGSDGKITVNGKEVNQILVNGKPFFDKDGQIALQNLPADMINKVQVTDTKTKKEEVSGEKASGDNASINLTIDEDKNKGLFGKFMAGYGTNDRYETSAIGNYFKDKLRISLLASSNNINSSGFSMDEIFDNMGGGRNVSVYAMDNGGVYINGMMFGGGSGITRSDLFGVNYSDEWAKDFDNTTSYFYNSASTDNDNKTRLETLLTNSDPNDTTDRRNIRESISSTKSDKYAHSIKSEFEIKPDSTSTINFSPKFVKANSKSNNYSSQSTRNQDDILLNESSGDYYSENDNNSFESELEYYKSLRRKGRGFGVSFSNTNNRDDGSNFNNSVTNFYGDEDGDGNPDTPADIRNQVRYSKTSLDNYSAGVYFTEPVTDSLKLTTNFSYESELSVQNRKGFDYDDATGDYTLANDLITNYVSSRTNTVTPGAGIELEKEKYSMRFSGGTAITQFKNFSSYLGTDYSLNKTYLLPDMDAYFRYKFDKSKYLSLYYYYNANFPSAQQVLPVEDLSNALYTSIGNPDLNPSQSNQFYLNFRNYDFSTRSGYGFYSGLTFYKDNIASFTEIDENAKQSTSYTNISGTYDMYLGSYYNKQYKKDAHTFRVNAGLSVNFDLNKGFTNQQLYEAENLRFSPRFSLTYEYGELLTITPSYELNYNETKYKNYSINEASNVVHNLNLQTTSYWPKHIVFGNDFGYTYNSNLGSGFKKDFFLWNTSLGYNFYQDKLLFKVKVYDILNQNLGNSRSITATGIYEQQNTVLKRYLMFSLTYKLSKFGAKEKKGGTRMIRF
ncbi:outer membrane beta-barrel protein [Flavobacterium alkalisoli]|uniref:Outer membrane beta-barrel protein n=1 Tax=Flavobacterium alkalisoli TaxID=2602769 RepID=A0A5B9FMS0_9FLAO|nr:outer membrane beta-barrel protein [Flavobacterium alkalisoli]QEE48180.1 outer membrane beta-barrel protein [Flavobacterium alkalisoli]